MKANMVCLVVNEPSNYWNWLSPLPEIKVSTKASVDFAHVFVVDQKTFEKQFIATKKKLKKDGMLWISWPKKSSGMETDLNENVIRDFGLKNGLVDVKVCAVDDTWSGLKFVYRLQDR